MNKKLMEKLLNKVVDTGANFSDIFYEDSLTKIILLSDGKIDKVKTSIINGVGIRLVFGKTVYNTSTNDLSEENLMKLVEELSKNGSDKRILSEIKLDKEITKKLEIEKANNKVEDSFKKEYLYKIDKIARKYDTKIVQVEAKFYEYNQDVNIGNTLGKYVTTNRSLTRLTIEVFAKEKDNLASCLRSFGGTNGYTFLDEIDIENTVKDLCKISIQKLEAKKAPGGMMPVIVGNGFGVLIHEAVGHSLEATTVAEGVGVLANRIGDKVASDIVTIVDDGTIPNAWGSTLIDDDGNEAKKNICIENGILKGYLIDEVNSHKMGTNATGSGRRESYHYITTSRMTNTNLLPGNDTVDEMIKSIDYGLYAKVMGGGSVDPITGDFNFAVNEAYMIRDGKIAEMVKGASLIGNTADIMEKIEMISDDFDADTGWCGSISGSIPVTCGEPTIKISSILVGGASND